MRVVKYEEKSKVAERGARGAGRRRAMLLREGLGSARAGGGRGASLRPGGGGRPAGGWLAQPKFGLPAVRKFAENFMLGARSTF